MNYLFPHITHIDEIRDAIKDRQDFAIFEREGYFLAHYLVISGDTFPPNDDLSSLILRECRGIAFDLKGNVISRPLHKFFNLNERPETQIGNLDLNKPHLFTPKLDGSMIRPIPIENSYRLATKMGISKVSDLAEKFIASRRDYHRFILDTISNGYTPIFEYCSDKQRIVVDYPQEKLVLVAIRHNHTGKYLSFEEMTQWLNGLCCEIPLITESEIDSLSSAVEKAKDLKDEEGWVLRFADGHMVKIKGCWYLRVHRLREKISSEKNLIALLINQELDDLRGFLLESDRLLVEKFESLFWQGLKATAEELSARFENYYREAVGERKYFALHIAPQLSSVEKQIFFTIWNGETAMEVLVALISKKIGSATGLEEVRHLWGGLNWNNFSEI